jgi:hypothetical protein
MRDTLSRRPGSYLSPGIETTLEKIVRGCSEIGRGPRIPGIVVAGGGGGR